MRPGAAADLAFLTASEISFPDGSCVSADEEQVVVFHMVQVASVDVHLHVCICEGSASCLEHDSVLDLFPSQSISMNLYRFAKEGSFPFNSLPSCLKHSLCFSQGVLPFL